ncbi:MAG: peptidylprolyl isomerase [Arenimonas sp.]|jgi:cyclophilin family peptidyl-prolyl cis-trans isomerase
MNPARSMLSLLFLFASCIAAPSLAQHQITDLAAPNAPIPVAGPRVAFETSVGRVVVELYPEKAPRTVANFLSYVRDGHYNGTVFHRVIPNLLIQGGAFTPDLQQKPERAPIANEANNGLSNLRGTLSAARRPNEKDSATAQFFINTVDNRQLDYRGDATPMMTGYCVFGRVVEGMDIVDKIRLVPTGPRPPLPADVPLTAVLVERASTVEP